MRHPQVLQLPIFNHCLKFNIYGHTRPQIVPKLLLQVFIRELHNSLVSEPDDGGLKEARGTENTVIIHYFYYFQPNFKNFGTIQGHVWL